MESKNKAKTHNKEEEEERKSQQDLFGTKFFFPFIKKRWNERTNVRKKK